MIEVFCASRKLNVLLIPACVLDGQDGLEWGR
jgi:hypothetical protein